MFENLTFRKDKIEEKENINTLEEIKENTNEINQNIKNNYQEYIIIAIIILIILISIIVFKKKKVRK